MLRSISRRRSAGRRGTVVVEYILLLTIVGIGAITGLVTLRNSLVNELTTISASIEGTPPADED